MARWILRDRSVSRCGSFVMLRTCFAPIVALLCALELSGCSRRALIVEPATINSGVIEGQTFCLAKGIVSLTVSYKPPAVGGSGPPGAGKSSLHRGGYTFGGAAGAAIASEPDDDEGVSPAPPDAIASRMLAAGAAASNAEPSGVTVTAENIKLGIDNVRFIPDCNYQYSVGLAHDIFHEDDVTIEVDPVTKLLKGVNSTLEDKTPEIVRKLAEAPGQILGGGTAGALGTVRRRNLGFEIRHDVDPTDPASVAVFNRHLRGLFPRVRLVTRPLIDLPNTARQPVPCSQDLCFRTAMPYVVELTTRGDEVARVISQQVVVVPNPYVVANIPVTRSAFVKKEVKLDFKDGMLVKTQIKNPSEMLGFIGIPIDIAKAIVSVPSAMLKFEIAHKQNDAALLDARAGVINSQKALIDAQRALLAGAAAGQQQAASSVP